MMKHEGGPAYAGIDPHADTQHVAVIAGHGRPLGDGTGLVIARSPPAAPRTPQAPQRQTSQDCSPAHPLPRRCPTYVLQGSWATLCCTTSNTATHSVVRHPAWLADRHGLCSFLWVMVWVGGDHRYWWVTTVLVSR